jgi:hypothetical protein
MKAGHLKQPDSAALGLVVPRTAEHRASIPPTNSNEPIKGSLPLPIARNGAAWRHPANMSYQICR